MFTPIRRILKDTLQKNGLAPHVVRARAFDVFSDLANGLLPEELRPECRPLKFQDGVLTVACRSMRAASALRAHEKELREKLAAADETIKRLRFLLAPWR